MASTPARIRDPLMDELSGPPTPRRPISGFPSAPPDSQGLSFEEYAERTLAKGARLRAKALPLSASPVELCNVHARAMYAKAVEKSGGATLVARSEGHNESAVRQRINHAKCYPNIAQVLAGLTPEGLVALADELVGYAREKARTSNGR
jgi:hypothetical protein